jgi:hypothetical protein
MSSDEDLFFLARGGDVWACWLSGKPAVNLGTLDEVRRAMRDFAAGPSGALREPSPTPRAAPPKPASEPRQVPQAPRASAPQQPPPSKPPRKVADRVEPRHDITIIGRIYTVSGSREVTVLDLSERGCRFNDATGSLSSGTRLTIKIGPVGPVEAEVKWREANAVGIAFATPLYPSVMRHIRDSFNLRR